MGARCAAILVASAAALVACSTPPTVLSNPRNSIMLQWRPGETSDSAVRTTAERHCESWGKKAVAGELQEKGDLRVQTFRCD
jgi:hypothetical protein